MNPKKIIISALAIISIIFAVYGFWELNNKKMNQPIRQEQEIR